MKTRNLLSRVLSIAIFICFALTSAVSQTKPINHLPCNAILVEADGACINLDALEDVTLSNHNAIGFQIYHEENINNLILRIDFDDKPDIHLIQIST